jgi:hypothetical protein
LTTNAYFAVANELVIGSHMPSSGVIFSDGIKSDFLEFNNASVARSYSVEIVAALGCGLTYWRRGPARDMNERAIIGRLLAAVAMRRPGRDGASAAPIYSRRSSQRTIRRISWNADFHCSHRVKPAGTGQLRQSSSLIHLFGLPFLVGYGS